MLTLLPEPDSPTIPTVSPAATSNESPRTAGAIAGAFEVDLQALDAEQRRAHRLSLGSSWSRSQSPKGLPPRTVSADRDPRQGRDPPG